MSLIVEALKKRNIKKFLGLFTSDNAAHAYNNFVCFLAIPPRSIVKLWTVDEFEDLKS